MSHEHRYADLLDVTCRALSEAGLPAQVLSSVARGWAVLKHAQGTTPVQASVRGAGSLLHLELSTPTASWVRAVATARTLTLESLSVAAAPPRTGEVLDLPVDGYAGGVAGDIPTMQGRLIPYMNGGWVVLHDFIPEWVPPEAAPRAVDALLSDAGFFMVQPNVLTNGYHAVIGPLKHRTQVDVRLLAGHLIQSTGE